MPVNYVLVAHGNPAQPAAPKKFYAQLKSTGEVTTRQLIEKIAARSTVSPADAVAVIESLLQTLPELLAEGAIVRLGDFGSFSASVSGEGAASEAEFVAARMITDYKIRFRPGQELRKAVANLTYRRVPK